MELDSSAMVVKALKLIDDTKGVAAQASINTTDFVMMAIYLVQLRPLLEELNKLQGFLLANPFWPALQQFTAVLEGLNKLTKACSSSSRIYLLFHYHAFTQDMDRSVKQLLECLALTLSECQEIPDDTTDTVVEVKDKLQSVTFSEQPGLAEISLEIQSCLRWHQEAGSDEGEWCRQATNLLQKIAKCMNVSVSEWYELKIELKEDLRIAEAEGREQEYIQELRDMCSFFGPAKVLGSNGLVGFAEFHSEHTMYSFEIPNPFFCPITKEVMREPVMLEQGHTYEKAAIVEWLGRGNKTCPDTGEKLRSLELIPNVKLQEAIDEYFSNMHKGQLVHVIQGLRSEITATDMEAQINSVKAILDLDPKYKRLLVSMDGIQPLVALLRQTKPHIRERILRILYSISVLGDEYKLSLLGTNSIHTFLRLLQKSPGDNGGPLQLLWELSKSEVGSKSILSEKGSVLIIASAFNLCQNDQKILAEKLMWNLCYYDESVIIEAARSSIFGPLIAAVTSGNDELKLKMVTAISSSLDLNDHNGWSLVKAGVVPPLLTLLQYGPSVNKHAAATALHRLSMIDLNKSFFAKDGAIPILVKLLDTPVPQLKIDILAILSNLATDRQNAVAINQAGGVMHHLGMQLTGDTVMQEYSLKTLQCMAKDSHIVRASVADLKMIPSLYRLLESEKVSANSQAIVLELLSYLAEDHVTCDALNTSIETVKFLVGLLVGSTNTECEATVLTILAGLSRIDDMKQKLITVENNILSLFAGYLESKGSNKSQASAAVILSQLCNPDFIGLNVLKGLAKQGLIPALIDVLSSTTSTEEAKHSVAITLKHFSKCSSRLTEVQPWLKQVLACFGVKKFNVCQVHAGKCTVKGTFCIVEANAVRLLINVVREGGTPISEEAIEVLHTLVVNKENTRRGVDCLVINGIIPALVSIVGKNDMASEKAAKVMEVIFRTKKYRDNQYSKLAKGSLATILATGTADARKLAATALMHLKELPRDSVYTFATASTST